MDVVKKKLNIICKGKEEMMRKVKTQGHRDGDGVVSIRSTEAGVKDRTESLW